MCLQGDERSEGKRFARVLTYGGPMEFDVHTQMHTHTAVFRRVSPMPFRMNVLWCQRGSPCAHTDRTIDKETREREKEGRYSKRGYLQKRETEEILLTFS